MRWVRTWAARPGNLPRITRCDSPACHHLCNDLVCAESWHQVLRRIFSSIDWSFLFVECTIEFCSLSRNPPVADFTFVVTMWHVKLNHQYFLLCDYFIWAHTLFPRNLVEIEDLIRVVLVFAFRWLSKRHLPEFINFHIVTWSFCFRQISGHISPNFKCFILFASKIHDAEKGIGRSDRMIPSILKVQLNWLQKVIHWRLCFDLQWLHFLWLFIFISKIKKSLLGAWPSAVHFVPRYGMRIQLNLLLNNNKHRNTAHEWSFASRCDRKRIEFRTSPCSSNYSYFRQTKSFSFFVLLTHSATWEPEDIGA
jgi:hypothetical protein